MKSYLALAWKELKAQKITAILILVAVIMSTIMTTVIGQSIGILQSMRIQQAAGLVIYNILKISITKRIKEYGTLRAIGGERGQIYRLVSLQLLILCGAGIPIGLLLGILSAKGVLIAATGLLNPDLFMANSTSELNSAINTASTV